MLYYAIGLGIPELVIILVIVLILFGAGKLPKVMAQLGKGTKAFKDGVKGDGTEDTAPAQIDVTPEPLAEDGDESVAEAIEVTPADEADRDDA
jgi:sec-independent protein translocase protein TatA